MIVERAIARSDLYSSASTRWHQSFYISFQTRVGQTKKLVEDQKLLCKTCIKFGRIETAESHSNSVSNKINFPTFTYGSESGFLNKEDRLLCNNSIAKVAAHNVSIQWNIHENINGIRRTIVSTSQKEHYKILCSYNQRTRFQYRKTNKSR